MAVGQSRRSQSARRHHAARSCCAVARCHLPRAGLHEQSTEHATLLSYSLRQCSRVHAVDSGHILLLQPCAERGLRQVVRVVLATIASHNQTSNVDLGGLEVCRQVLQDGVPVLSRGNTIVADQGKGDDQDLAAVRRIGDRLWVADHTSLKDQLASNAPMSAEADTFSEANGLLAMLDLKGHHLLARHFGAL